MDAFDYVIVGAGSAGCVLADRLSADGTARVLLIEAGGSDRSIFIQMPTALSIPMNMKKFNWFFESEPEPHLDNRRMHCPRGKVLGGSSSINGMVYVRGHPCDFEEWEEQGAQGWGYRNCLPYFRRAETWKAGGDDYRGGDGPLGTCNGNEMQNPLYRAFVEAGRQAGYLPTEDYNGYQQEGFGAMHMTVKNGVRWSTANAYLKPALGRPNLKVVSNALTRRVVFEGKTAVGVDYQVDGRSESVRAGREVILSAGSIGSPQLLQLSGIGPGQVLQDAGVPVVHELPGVGENLQDHLEVYFQFRCTQPVTLNGQLDPFHKFLIGSRWFFFKTGLGATNHFESCAHPLQGGRQVARHPVPLPAGGHALRRPERLRRPRLPAPRWAQQAEEPRLGANHVRRSAGQAEDPLQLHGTRGRPVELPCLPAALPGDHRSAGHGPLPGRGDPAGRFRRERRGDGRVDPAERRERLSPLVHLQDRR
jgi:choline dehydrogenase